MKIHFLRHGETEANNQTRLQGHYDTPLTEIGEENTENIAHTIKHREYDIIFSSPLKRALDTSKLVAQQLGTDIRIEPELKEICYGDWEEKRKDKLQQHNLWEERENDKYNFVHPGEYNGFKGQSYADIFDQIIAFCRQVAESDYKLVLVITHLGVLRNVMKYTENCSAETAVSFTPDVNQAYEVVIEDDDVSGTVLNMS